MYSSLSLLLSLSLSSSYYFLPNLWMVIQRSVNTKCLNTLAFGRGFPDFGERNFRLVARATTDDKKSEAVYIRCRVSINFKYRELFFVLAFVFCRKARNVWVNRKHNCFSLERSHQAESNGWLNCRLSRREMARQTGERKDHN